MDLTSTDIKLKMVHYYYRQYIQNYKGLNMDFTEFISTKLGLSEQDSLKVIHEWKGNLLSLTKAN
jgi:hypothetical protein